MSQQHLSNQLRNRVLSSLTEGDLALIEPFFEPVALKFRQRLESANKRIRKAYFPNRGIASVVAVTAVGRRQAEVALVGRNGMTGLAVVLGADSSPYETFIQIAGDGQSIAADDLRRVMEKSTSIRACFLR